MNTTRSILAFLFACGIAFATLLLTRPFPNAADPLTADTWVYRVDTHVTSADPKRAADSAPAVAWLNEIVPDFEFKNATLADVVQFFQDTTKQNIFVNWPAIAATSVDTTATISVHLRNLSRSAILSRVLTEFGGADVRLSYTVDGNIISISTLEALDNTTFTRVYDIRDLVLAQKIWSPVRPTQAYLGAQIKGPVPLPSTQSTGGPPPPSSFNSPGEDLEPAWYATQDIMKLIQEVVFPDTWRESGGTIGSICELGGRLVITQTASGHQHVEQFLNLLREGK